jgi:hypothetical protein
VITIDGSSYPQDWPILEACPFCGGRLKRDTLFGWDHFRLSGCVNRRLDIIWSNWIDEIDEESIIRDAKGRLWLIRKFDPLEWSHYFSSESEAIAAAEIAPDEADKRIRERAEQAEADRASRLARDQGALEIIEDLRRAKC